MLYVSDANDGQVSVFSYPQGVLMQTLTGFEEPYGLCADKAGDVWIVDDETSAITEYAHAATSSMATLSDSGEYPAGCSVDPTTGNLAVTNYETGSRGQGGISLYKKAKGNPTVLTDSAISRGWFCSYDDKGNLYLDGDTAGSSGFQLAVLPHGSSSFTNISVSEKITVPGGVQWDGRYVAVSDANGPGPGTVYQFSINGSTATEVSSSVLQDSQNIHQFWIDPKRRRIVAPSASLSTVGFWKFPAGNDPTKTISGLDIPEGVAISKAGR
ncbi:MAG TPA: hypothetical protein VGX91_01295 [Candidatus Cybelea sp.]|nr:hypothetical protein [Candidatus Cybelea sp.]